LKRALLAISLLVLGAVAWWAQRSAARSSEPSPVAEAPGEALVPVGTTGPTSSPGTTAADAAVVLGPLPVLRGEVRDDTGGIAQATLDARHRGESKEPGCTAEAHTTSVAGGSFDLGALCPGQYDVRAARGANVATAVARLTRGPSGEPLVLFLHEGTRLTVRVRDEKKAPLAGAEVHVQDVQSGFLADAVTDDKGLAVVGGLSPRQHSVWGSKAGYLEASLHGRTLAPGEDEVELVLVPGVRFEGRVVDADGTGVDRAWVRLATRRKELGGGFDTVESGGSTDGGEFAIGPVRPGAYVAVASHDDWQQLEQPVRVPGPKVTLKLGRGTTVDGLFLDADGAPLSQGDISASFENEADSRNADVDEWGRFKLSGLGRGKWALFGRVKSTDGGPTGVTVKQLTVKGEQRLQVTLQLERGERIEGRCVNADGTSADTDVIAVEQAVFKRLKLSGIDLTRLAPGSVAFSSCSDRFVLDGLAPGRYALLACGNDDDPALANTGDRDVSLKCNEGELRFRVVDSAHRPVERYAVGLSDPESFPDGRFKRPLHGTTDEVLTVRAPGYAPLQRRLEAKRGELVDLGELQVSATRKVSGRVVDAKDDAPVAGAEVRFGVDHEDSLHHARTAADGRFELVDVARESGTLFVAHPKYGLASVEVGPAQERADVALHARLELSGAVITRDGREPRGFEVEARGPGAAYRHCEVTDGRYTVGSLEPGEWKLRLLGSEVSGFDPLTVTLVGSGSVSADFVERAGGVSVSVLPLDDEGHPIVALVWLLPGRRTLPATRTDAFALATGAGIGSEGDPSGAHSFSSVSPGPYTAVIQVKELTELMWAEAFEVSPGMAAPLRLMMPRGLAPLK
jgi:hypothetical protein